MMTRDFQGNLLKTSCLSSEFDLEQYRLQIKAINRLRISVLEIKREKPRQPHARRIVSNCDLCKYIYGELDETGLPESTNI